MGWGACFCWKNPRTTFRFLRKVGFCWFEAGVLRVVDGNFAEFKGFFTVELEFVEFFDWLRFTFD